MRRRWSVVFLILALIAAVAGILYGLPILTSGNLDAGTWAFVAVMISLATYMRLDELLG